MARKQNFKSGGEVDVLNPAIPRQLITTELLVKSVIIQAKHTNTDFVFVGDASNQVHAIAPGDTIAVHGDALDHGGFAMVDLSQIWLSVSVGSEGFTYMYLEGI